MAGGYWSESNPTREDPAFVPPFQGAKDASDELSTAKVSLLSGEFGDRFDEEVKYPAQWVQATKHMLEGSHGAAIPLLDELCGSTELPSELPLSEVQQALIESIWNQAMLTLKLNNPSAAVGLLGRLGGPPLCSILPENIQLSTVRQLQYRAEEQELKLQGGANGSSATGARLRMKLEAKRKQEEEEKAKRAAEGVVAGNQAKNEDGEEDGDNGTEKSPSQRGPRRGSAKGKKKKKR